MTGVQTCALPICLQQYGYSSELVINNILEERLAPDLLQLDRAMPRYTGQPPLRERERERERECVCVCVSLSLYRMFLSQSLYRYL